MTWPNGGTPVEVDDTDPRADLYGVPPLRQSDGVRITPSALRHALTTDRPHDSYAISRATGAYVRRVLGLPDDAPLTLAHLADATGITP